MLNTYLKEQEVAGNKLWKTYIAIDDLKLDKQNPREISSVKAADLDYFIDKYELLAPLLVDGRPGHEGELLGGNMRYQRYKAKGRTEVWIEVRYPESDAAAFEIATVSNMQFGTYVQKLLADLTKQHRDTIDVSRLSVPLAPETDLAQLLDKMKQKDGVTQDTPPAVDANNIKSYPGGRYQLGRHVLVCGDATKIEDMDLLMGELKADMIFTDPPYNVDYGAKNKALNQTDRGSQIDADIKNDKFNTPQEFYQFLYHAYNNMFEHSKSGASIYVCHADIERVNFTNAFVDAGWKLSEVIIWAKQTMVLGRQDYHWQHEPILYGWKEGETHYFAGGRAQTTLWAMDRPTQSQEHPTMKPLNLVARALANSSKGDDIILDPFLGSGSTLIACEQTGRTCYGMELDPKYCDVIRKRYAKLIGREDWEAATPLMSETPIAAIGAV